MSDTQKITTPPVAPLRAQVDLTLRQYFQHLGEYVPNNLYKFVLSEVEPPLLQIVLEHAGGNQSRAAEILGLDRGTLRKKLREHGLI